MADSKITALAALTAADPVNDMFPVVDVSDTSMAASGTTKRISANNILSSSPTASGALTVTGLVTAGSATITGDLTVDTSTLKVDSTNDRVGIGVTTFVADGNVPLQLTTVGSGSRYVGINRQNAYGVIVGWDGVADSGEIRIVGAYPLKFGTTNVKRYEIDATGISTWSVAGSTAMTLNSTGLGIGDSPFSGTRLTLKESATNPNVFALINRNATQTWKVAVDTAAVDDKILGFFSSTTSGFVLSLTDTGNLLVNVPTTPPTLAENSQMVFNLTSNTNLRISVRGTDGTTRTANITLA